MMGLLEDSIEEWKKLNNPAKIAVALGVGGVVIIALMERSKKVAKGPSTPPHSAGYGTFTLPAGPPPLSTNTSSQVTTLPQVASLPIAPVTLPIAPSLTSIVAPTSGSTPVYQPTPVAPMPLPASHPFSPAAQAPVQQKNTTYTVQSGDWLSKIAPHYGITWQQLYAANVGVIGADPNLIKPGQVLTIPGR